MLDNSSLNAEVLHELRNLIHLAMLNLGIILDQYTTPSLENYSTAMTKITVASDALSRVQTILRDYQDPEPIIPAFFPHQEIQKILSLYETQVEKKDITVKFDVKTRLLFPGDPVKFAQVITNIFSNAIDAYRSSQFHFEQKVIQLKLWHTETALVLEIKDWGRGIPSDHLARIFDPYFTTKTPSPYLEGGSGMGLTVVKKILEHEFHGSINVISEVGKGTTFTLHFPLL